MWLRILLAEDGAPQLGYRQDLHEACAICGKEHVVRRYSEYDLHRFTTARLRRLSERPADAAPFVCEQCGHAVAGTSAVHSVFGPASVGRVECWRSGELELWKVEPRAVLDAQELARPVTAPPPHEGWQPWPGARGLASLLGRWWSPKERIRAALAAGERPEKPEFLADGLVWCATREAAGYAWLPLVSEGVAAAGGAGFAEEWLGDLASGVEVWAGVESERWASWMTAATTDWPLEVDVVEADGFLSVARRDDPDDLLARWTVSDLTREAALTATAPADVATIAVQRALALRLTAGTVASVVTFDTP